MLCPSLSYSGSHWNHSSSEKIHLKYDTSLFPSFLKLVSAIFLHSEFRNKTFQIKREKKLDVTQVRTVSDLAPIIAANDAEVHSAPTYDGHVFFLFDADDPD